MSFTEQNWQDEIKKSLKVDVLPEFKKYLFADQSISPFSRPVEQAWQGGVISRAPFLAIQNYHELKKSDLAEWLKDEDIGFRFRELSDLMACEEIRSRSFKAYLSQPFPFALNAEQTKFLEDFAGRGSSVNLGWSPLSFGLTRGEILKKPFQGWETIFKSPALQDPHVKWFYLSSAPYEWAGAEPHVEVAVLLSLGHAIVNELAALGIPPSISFQKMSFGLSLSTDVLIESSKITAMRLGWARLAELHNAPLSTDIEVYALPSLRHFSGRDPWNNIMRMTLMAFSAMAGGAQGFKCIPYDVLNKFKSQDAIRVSTNIPLILKKEGLIADVKNPLDGASLFMKTIDVLCKSAWSFFQEIEKKGGVFESVRSGWLQTELKRSDEFTKNKMRYLQTQLIGVNKFISRNPYSQNGEVPEIIRLGDIIDPLFLQRSEDDYLTVEPLIVSALSYEWESLQLQSDRAQKRTGKRPSVTVVRGGGPVVEKRSAWLSSMLAVGGIEARFENADTFDGKNFSDDFVILLPSNDEMDEALTHTLSTSSRTLWSLAPERQDSRVDRYFDVSVNGYELIKDLQKIILEAP